MGEINGVYGRTDAIPQKQYRRTMLFNPGTIRGDTMPLALADIARQVESA